ncbi:hypothetical protein K2P56_00100 [Patescibacteria group bacterium]|nr:hypothetical protein [Patescibacteria group bacterium]
MFEADERYLTSLARTNPNRASFLRTSLENSEVPLRQTSALEEELSSLIAERKHQGEEALAHLWRGIHDAIPNAIHPAVREGIFFANLTRKKEN